MREVLDLVRTEVATLEYDVMGGLRCALQRFVRLQEKVVDVVDWRTGDDGIDDETRSDVAIFAGCNLTVLFCS